MDTALTSFVDRLLALRPQAAPAGLAQPSTTQALFSTLFDRQLLALLGAEAVQLVGRTAAQYLQAVQLCRQDELVAALAQLQLTDAGLAALPPAVLDFVTLYQLSAWGNYYYKAREGARGLALMEEGLHRSVALEYRGYDALLFRRIEQVHNIAMLHYQQGDAARGHQLLKDLLTFVHTGQAPAGGLIVAEWPGAVLRRTRVFQEFALDESCSRLAAHNTRCMTRPGFGARAYYEAFGRGLLRELTVDTYNRTVLYNWLYCQASYFEQGPAAFLENVLLFVGDADITAAYDVLRANLLAQAIGHFQPTAGAGEEPLLTAIRTFAAHHLLDRSGKAIRLAA